MQAGGLRRPEELPTSCAASYPCPEHPSGPLVTGVCRIAAECGLEVHAGHGLDYRTAEKLAHVPQFVEFNIGHFMVGEAIFVGFGETVRQMKAAMARGRKLR